MASSMSTKHHRDPPREPPVGPTTTRRRHHHHHFMPPPPHELSQPFLGSTQPTTTTAATTTTSKLVPCRYGMACRNRPYCPLDHGSDNVTTTRTTREHPNDSFPRKSTTTTTAATTKPKPKLKNPKKPCRNGSTCPNRPHCPFGHDDDDEDEYEYDDEDEYEYEYEYDADKGKGAVHGDYAIHKSRHKDAVKMTTKKKTKKPPPCRNGSFCPNRPHCPFGHDDIHHKEEQDDDDDNDNDNRHNDAVARNRNNRWLLSSSVPPTRSRTPTKQNETQPPQKHHPTTTTTTTTTTKMKPKRPCRNGPSCPHRPYCRFGHKDDDDENNYNNNDKKKKNNNNDDFKEQPKTKDHFEPWLASSSSCSSSSAPSPAAVHQSTPTSTPPHVVPPPPPESDAMHERLRHPSQPLPNKEPARSSPRFSSPPQPIILEHEDYESRKQLPHNPRPLTSRLALYSNHADNPNERKQPDSPSPTRRGGPSLASTATTVLLSEEEEHGDDDDKEEEEEKEEEEKNDMVPPPQDQRGSNKQKNVQQHFGNKKPNSNHVASPSSSSWDTNTTSTTKVTTRTRISADQDGDDNHHFARKDIRTKRNGVVEPNYNATNRTRTTGRPCWYGTKCRAPNCPFVHPAGKTGLRSFSSSPVTGPEKTAANNSKGTSEAEAASTPNTLDNQNNSNVSVVVEKDDDDNNNDDDNYDKFYPALEEEEDILRLMIPVSELEERIVYATQAPAQAHAPLLPQATNPIVNKVDLELTPNNDAKQGVPMIPAVVPDVQPPHSKSQDDDPESYQSNAKRIPLKMPEATISTGIERHVTVTDTAGENEKGLAEDEDSQNADDILDDEERERYKAQRKAAKKERRRLEKEAKAAADAAAAAKGEQRHRTSQQHLAPLESQDTKFSQTQHDDDDDDDDDDEERETRSDAYRRSSSTSLSRKELKKVRYERFLAELEQQQEERAKIWKDAIVKEEQTVSFMIDFCLAEFVRVHSKKVRVDRETLRENKQVMSKLRRPCSTAYHELFGSDDDDGDNNMVSNRVVVKGLPNKQKDLNDRTGTIRYWDSSAGKYLVGLDTKKGKNSSRVLFAPGNLEPLPTPSSSNNAKSKQKDKSHNWWDSGDRVAGVKVPDLYEQLDLQVDLYKSQVVRISKALLPASVINNIMAARTREEQRQKEAEAFFKAQEEEARRRHEENRRREQEEYNAQKKAYEEFRRKCQEEWAKERQRERQERWGYAYAGERFGGAEFHRGFGFGRCQCLRCRINAFFEAAAGDSRHYRHRYYDDDDDDGDEEDYSNYQWDNDDDDDDDDDDKNDDAWDRRWNQMRRDKERHKRQEAANVLGVSVDASADDIKRMYRRKALMYHPDRFRPEDFSDGTTKEEAAQHMQEINNAYAVLINE